MQSVVVVIVILHVIVIGAGVIIKQVVVIDTPKSVSREQSLVFEQFDLSLTVSLGSAHRTTKPIPASAKQ